MGGETCLESPQGKKPSKIKTTITAKLTIVSEYLSKARKRLSRKKKSEKPPGQAQPKEPKKSRRLATKNALGVLFVILLCTVFAVAVVQSLRADELYRQVNDLKWQVSNQTIIIDEQNITIYNSNATIQNKTITIQELSEKLVNTQNHEKELQSKLNDREAAIRQMDTTIIGLQKELDGIKSQILQLNGQISALQLEAQTKNDTIKQLNSQIASLQLDAAARETLINQLSTQITQLNAEVDELKAEIYNLKTFYITSIECSTSCECSEPCFVAVKGNYSGNAPDSLDFWVAVTYRWWNESFYVQARVQFDGTGTWHAISEFPVCGTEPKIIVVAVDVSNSMYFFGQRLYSGDYSALPLSDSTTIFAERLVG
jgi:hypothetical protein